LVDTGVFLSAADRDEPSHQRCSHLLQVNRDELATTGPVVAETAWMIESRLGTAAESTFVAAVAAGRIAVIDLTPALYQRCVDLIDAYADLGLGLVDASLIATAEHHNQTRIATLNHRDFTVVRPAHTETFELLPGTG
jgi:predicted nucleic acid-binding protein